MVQWIENCDVDEMSNLRGAWPHCQHEISLLKHFEVAWNQLLNSRGVWAHYQHEFISELWLIEGSGGGAVVGLLGTSMSHSRSIAFLVP